jgi:hypothetical protein
VKRKLILILGIILLFAIPCYAGQIWTVGGTKTNCISDSVRYTDPVKIAGYNVWGFKFNITILDTLKTDSVSLAVQTSDDKISWRTFATVTKYVADTTSKYGIFTLDTLKTLENIGAWARLKYTTNSSATDTATAETLQLTGNGSVLNWLNVNKTSPGADTTRWSVLNETTLDTTDYDSSKTIRKWLALSFANHTKTEPTINSITLIARGGFDSDTAWIKYGLSLGANASGAETLAAKITMSSRTKLAAKDTTTCTTTFTTNPYGTAWKWYQLDSLNFVAYADTLRSGAIAKINKVIAIVNFTKGTFEPPITWTNRWILKDKDNDY